MSSICPVYVQWKTAHIVRKYCINNEIILDDIRENYERTSKEERRKNEGRAKR
jgi:hypothetical protein